MACYFLFETDAPKGLETAMRVRAVTYSANNRAEAETLFEAVTTPEGLYRRVIRWGDLRGPFWTFAYAWVLKEESRLRANR
jgi:hypothetical protein